MKLYEATNGFMRFSYVRAYVIAENEERALQIAKDKFKENNRNHGSRYWENVEVKAICEDTTKEFISDIED
jgi:hypothetical protein